MELSPTSEATSLTSTGEFPNFMEQECSAPCTQEPSTGPCHEPDQSSPCHLIISILIISTHLYLGLLVVTFLLVFHQNAVCISLLPHVCYMPQTSHSPCLDHSNYTWWRVLSYEALHYAVFFELLSLQPSSVKIFTSALCSQTPSV
jgi:hypothetical protein